MPSFRKPPLSTAIASLEKAHRSRQQQKAEMLESLLLEAGVPADVAATLALNLQPQKLDRWEFVMLNPKQNCAVVDWLRENSKRPLQALGIWATLLAELNWETGEVRQSREQLAARAHVRPNTLSAIMSELASINAIRREYSGRGVTYFLNPNIATHIPSAEKREAARKGVKPVLKVVEKDTD